jgi:cyclophilin family peptidyl-prolyl cis-trans isomerase
VQATLVEADEISQRSHYEELSKHMTPKRICSVLLAVLLADAAASAEAPRTMADVLAASKAGDWRSLDPENALYLDLPAGRVIIELAPDFAPKHVANLRTLVRGQYFDGLAINRVQDNFVVQWGDPDGKKPLGAAQRTLAPEFTRSAANLPFVALPDPDTYAAQTGFAAGFPAARDGQAGSAWLVHCYGMVGVGRDNPADSGGGTELYTVTGHAPRQLDRNITLVGRVVYGMEILSSLPRGAGAMGFYEKPEQRVAIRQIRLAADVPPEQRTPIELLRTDTTTFTDLVESRRNRREEWYKVPAGRIEICNVPLPVRIGKQ